MADPSIEIWKIAKQMKICYCMKIFPGYGCDLTKSGCKTSLDLTKHKHKLPPHVEDLSYINVKTLSFTCSSKALRLEHCIYP